MKKLYIVRGLPGSGKTTFVNEICCDLVFSADDYFINEDGEYVFVPSKIGEAHKSCQNDVLEAMIHSVESIAVANTFTQEWEIQPYLDMAKEYDYMVFSIIVENRHGNTNIHNVPDSSIAKMKNRFHIQLTKN